MERIELCMHSNMSTMDGVTNAAALVEQAFRWGHKAVAVTDSGDVGAFPEIMKKVEEIRKNGGEIKPIYGMEAYFVNDSNGENLNELPVYRITILVKNQLGLKNLYKLISLSNLNYFLKVPRIPLFELLKHREGLLIGSGYDFIDELCGFYDYYEIQPTADDAKLKALNKRIVELADKHGKLCAATGNVHYKDKEDEIIYKIIRSECGEDTDKLPPMHFRTTDEMLSDFNYLGEEKAFEVVVTNTNKIADMIDGNVRPIPEGRFTLSLPNAERELIDVCRGKARELYGEKLPKTAESRLERELELITKHGFSDYYMLAQKFVKYSEENGYYVGARGSVGSSFAAYLLGITGVDPLPPHYRCPKCKHSEFITDGSVGSGFDLPPKSCPDCGEDMTRSGHDIPYETFMGFDGDKFPDIDLNFSGEIQEKIHRYSEELFGKGRVFKAGVNSYVRRQTADVFVKKYCDKYGISFDDAKRERLVNGCADVKRSSSSHPGGLLIIPNGYEVCDFTPVHYPMGTNSGDMPATMFEFYALHDTIYKFDLLGHDVPTIYKRLEDMTGIKIFDVPMTDPLVYKLFTSAEQLKLDEDVREFFEREGILGTRGLPEFGTHFVSNMLIKAQPKTFSDLIKISGLAHGTDVWINNADLLIELGICTVSDVIATRDDIYLYLTHKGIEPKLAYRITEITRNGKAEQQFDDEIYMAFEDHDIPKWFVSSCRKIRYIFPKAHAAAYVTSAVKLAWFKLYRPAEFYAALISKHTDDLELDTVLQGKEAVRKRIDVLSTSKIDSREEKMLDVLGIVLELLARGIEILTPDIVRSDAELCTVEDGKIRLPLCSVAGVGHNSAIKIKEAVDKLGCASFDEMQQKSGVSIPIIKTLKEAKAKGIIEF